jgi:hypothetical protein
MVVVQKLQRCSEGFSQLVYKPQIIKSWQSMLGAVMRGTVQKLNPHPQMSEGRRSTVLLHHAYIGYG